VPEISDNIRQHSLYIKHFILFRRCVLTPWFNKPNIFIISDMGFLLIFFDLECYEVD